MSKEIYPDGDLMQMWRTAKRQDCAQLKLLADLRACGVPELCRIVGVDYNKYFSPPIRSASAAAAPKSKRGGGRKPHFPWKNIFNDLLAGIPVKAVESKYGITADKISNRIGHLKRINQDPGFTFKQLRMLEKSNPAPGSLAASAPLPDAELQPVPAPPSKKEYVPDTARAPDSEPSVQGHDPAPEPTVLAVPAPQKLAGHTALVFDEMHTDEAFVRCLSIFNFTRIDDTPSVKQAAMHLASEISRQLTARLQSAQTLS